MFNYFDKIAERYDKWYETSLGRYVDTTEKELIFSLLESKKGLALDLGCGTGNYTFELKNRGFEVVGLDISKEMLRIAKNKMPEILFVRGDAYLLPFKDNTFDLVLSVTMFEFIKKPENVLKEIYRILKPEGEIVIGTMNAKSLWFLFKRLKSIFKETAYRYARFYTVSELKNLLEKENFRKIKTGGVIFFPSFFPFLNLARRFDEKFCFTFFKNFSAFVVVKGTK